MKKKSKSTRIDAVGFLKRVILQIENSEKGIDGILMIVGAGDDFQETGCLGPDLNPLALVGALEHAKQRVLRTKITEEDVPL